MSLIWNDDVMANAKVLASTDHPLSLGYTIFLITNSTLACEEDRATEEMWKHLHQEESPTSGMHAVWDNRKIIAVVINGFERDRPVPMGRIVELITHEVSHLVDGMFERAHVSKIDTEVRAYYTDWLVGKALHSFPAMW